MNFLIVFLVDVVEIHWKHLDKTIHKIGGMLEVISTSLELNFISKTEQDIITSTMYIMYVYHCISDTVSWIFN